MSNNHGESYDIAVGGAMLLNEEYHYFYNVQNPNLHFNDAVFFLIHDNCNSCKHEITSVTILIEPTSNIDDSIDALAALMKFKIRAQTYSKLTKNLGIQNWTDEKMNSYGTYVIDEDKNLRPLPIVIDNDVKYIEVHFARYVAGIESLNFDIKSTCKFRIVPTRPRAACRLNSIEVDEFKFS